MERSGDSAGRRRTTRRTPPQVSAEMLARTALRYLERFDATEAKLRRVLRTHVQRSARVHDTDLDQAERWIDELIERYRGSGLVNDARYAESLWTSLRARGASERQIVQKLRARGARAQAIEALVQTNRSSAADDELAAARQFARKRRLGPHRPESERAAKAQRDLAALARAGFSYEVARKVLGPTDPDDDAF